MYGTILYIGRCLGPRDQVFNNGTESPPAERVGSRRPLEGAGISNIEYRLHECRSGHPLIEKEERSDSSLRYSIFLVRHSTFAL